MAAVVPLLTTRSLSRRFGGLQAVANVDFQVQRGEIRAIIGPNGAGKTTLVSLVCGRIPPSEGTIVFEGEDITGLPAHTRVLRGIAYTFQITSVFANLTCHDNVALAVQRTLLSKQRWGRLDRHALTAEVMAALERVGIADLAAVPAGKLSYGHQRLLEVAMGLALNPRLLILDEPTQGLSDAEIASFCDLVRAIAEEATILLIEHNMHVVMSLAHTITVMNNGAILAEGDPAAISANADVQQAYLGG